MRLNNINEAILQCGRYKKRFQKSWSNCPSPGSQCSKQKKCVSLKFPFQFNATGSVTGLFTLNLQKTSWLAHGVTAVESYSAEAASIIAANTPNPPFLPTLRPQNSFLLCTLGLSLTSVRQSASLTSFRKHEAIKWTAVHCLTTRPGVAVLNEDAGEGDPSSQVGRV